MSSFRLAMGLCLATGSAWAAPVEFNRDVRAILSKNCFACHGQDAKHRKGKLRIDTAEGAFSSKNGVAAIVAGNVSESELWARVNSKDPDEMMPPPETKKSLTAEEKQTLKRWIEQGAKYENHWAFITPKKSKVPAGGGNPIDAFLQRRLAKEGLKAAPLAKPETLVRRVYLDLTGLPPTPKEVDAFIANKSPKALEKLIDNLMQRQTYGEHMARYWLDLARYADTHGLHLDNERSMWPYRDWVVRAFNQNLSFDKFTRWQLAGDLLPKPTLDQQIASGFNRCNVTTGEGGSITAEWIYRNAVDRTSTAVEVWMGMTAGCAVCHDHKFDPISTKEFYSMYSFFHSAADPALDGNKLDTPPILRVPQPGSAEKLAALDAKIKTIKQRIASAVMKIKYTDPASQTPLPKVITKETIWIEDAVPPKGAAQGNTPWKFVSKPDPVFSGKKASVREAKGLSQHFFTGANPPLSIESGTKLFAHVYLDTLNPPKQIMLQFYDGTWEHRAYWGGDKIPWGNNDSVSRKRLGDLPETGKWIRLEVDATQVGLKPGTKLNGWAFTQFDGKVYWDKAGVSSTTHPAKDPAFSWAAWKAQTEGSRNKDLTEALRKRFKGKAPDKWTAAEETELRQHWLARVYAGAQKELGAIKSEQADLEKQQSDIRKNTAVTFVMADLPKPRQSFVMLRGQYDRPGEKVSRNVPAFLPPLPAKPKERDYNRLDFANWLVDGKHPLTARVAVNRIWQQFFGVGLVKTSADFGTQGELPMHPELLDWLAVQFVEDGWDVQQLVKRILTSHTYRQSSRATPAALKRDPENRLLAHAPRFRLDAEVLRDQALSLSGLLVLTLGGRGVRPYQPPNIWEPVGFASSNTRNYKQGKGDDLYRRSIYTFLKRTAPAPFMTSFDAPSREQSCTVRGRSNTPMQALQLMNDVQHVEAARNLAQRILNAANTDDNARIRWAWRAVTSRQPDATEAQIIANVLASHRSRFEKDTEAAKKLTAFGESKADLKLKPVELAAWTLVANLLLNLDEVVNKN
ncbi:MAG: PSD1 and planctomycete cytochrome C domain-containing protein [Verrucomicrobiota bacterium]|nr:PSD1 and planctomycete cytochrome C domain-containing protein [Verrucomicrobiota bacterium]